MSKSIGNTVSPQDVMNKLGADILRLWVASTDYTGEMAVILAVTLAEKLGCGVNDLPLSLVLSWFEQKAIVILLTLLSLGVTNIVTGPTAPGFLTPDLLAVLNEKFGLRSVTNVEDDMQQLLSA
jgi:hydroxylamine reductase